MRPKNLEKEEAIRTIALQIIAEEGLENLTMQKLAKAANISPRTIYIKYKDKEDLLIKLFIEEVLGPYETAVLENFHASMDFATGVKKLWQNSFRYLTRNRTHFALLQNGKTSPLLNKAYQQANIEQGQYFKPIHQFFKQQVKQGVVRNFHQDIYRALLFAPLLELVNEYFDYTERPKQIITEKVILDCCEAVIKGMLK
ncbi:transcriptional regulator, TetR family [Chitinophaga ginsengisegetis]|uniref:Transcriptional regulator, TetR family n=1 Tax=Chitinophaga ginsengisegetis TaxID=393003 RepID=A0A1T5N7Y7_9BACT|nr:TetR/AcrR family transcriptional regulator [Chitinophaga ginsengisegetis]MDR6568596.1 AcrR family transcriptional regulator [Chitinophaga ginsengisegetis]MDR6648173.1 AcrR family transcriptional regulator [Chitinophaga ginsengisegetis]MDR6654677.1 AcrR family transcriptional regulator [Chitinophaga ginsengisegetis]SKC96319.1 transcriptional regulator, TetR family [Chitinophaga ginsengisegetis]